MAAPIILQDSEIFEQIKSENIQGWVHLYDKYSSAIFGMICKLAPNQIVSEKILVDYFGELHQHHARLIRHNNLFSQLIKHCFTFTADHLTLAGMHPQKVGVRLSSKIKHSSLATATQGFKLVERDSMTEDEQRNYNYHWFPVNGINTLTNSV